MTSEHYLIETTTPDALRAVVHTLASRRVPVRGLTVVSPPAGGGPANGAAPATGHHLRLTTDPSGPATAELLVKRLNRLIDVVRTTRVSPEAFHQRRAVVVQVEADDDERTRLLVTAAAMGAEVVEVDNTCLTLALLATPERIDELLGLLDGHRTVDLADTGVLAVRRHRRRASRRRLPAQRTGTPVPLRSAPTT